MPNLTGSLSLNENLNGNLVDSEYTLTGRLATDPEYTLTGVLTATDCVITGFLNNATLRGIPVELRVTNTTLQWKYLDEDTWTDLIDLNELDYERLGNLPYINNVKLIGNKSLADLGIASRSHGVVTITRNGTTFTVTRPDGTSFTFDQKDTTYDNATSSTDGLMSAGDKAKLDTIEADADVNIIESISVNGTAQTVTSKNVDITVPTDTSDLTNSAGYQNATQVENAITAKGYQTSAQVESAIAEKGYQTSSQVESAITSKGYQTASQVENKIESYGYQNATDVESKVESYGYQTASDVESKVEGYGYQTESDVATKIESYGYQTAADVDGVLPKKVSDLTNDAEYTTKQYVDDEIAGITIEVDSTLSQQGKAADAKAVGDAVSRIDGELNSKQDVLDFGTPTSADVGKALMPKTVENGEVTEWEFGEAGKVDDVQVNGVSVLNNKVANVSVPTNNNQLANGAGYQTASDVSSSIATALGDITTISYHVCTEQEFDPDTLIPTLQGEVGVVYLVPRTDAIAGSAVVGVTDLDEVEENNVYLEFIYVDGGFEKIGAIGDIDLDGYITDDDIATNQDVEDMLDEIGL